MLCGLYSWTESRFMIRNHSTAVVPGLIVSDVNFNFSCFIHNNGFVFCKSGVLLLLHHRDTVSCSILVSRTLSYNVVQKCATLQRVAFGAWKISCSDSAEHTSWWTTDAPFTTELQARREKKREVTLENRLFPGWRVRGGCVCVFQGQVNSVVRAQ